MGISEEMFQFLQRVEYRVRLFLMCVPVNLCPL